MPEMSSQSSLAAPILLDFRDLWIYNAFFTRQDCVLLNSVQEFIEIEAWLLLTLFIRLHIFFISSTFISNARLKLAKN